jgi:hypothetical protein
MTEPTRPARLWYQSFVHPTEQAPYMERLQGLLDGVAGPGIRFEVHGLDPPDHLFHPLTEFRCAAQTIRNAWRPSARATTASSSATSRSPACWKSAGRSTFPSSVSARRPCWRH